MKEEMKLFRLGNPRMTEEAGTFQLGNIESMPYDQDFEIARFRFNYGNIFRLHVQNSLLFNLVNL